MSLTYLIIPSKLNDQPIDFLDDEEFVCEFNLDASDQLESLDDAINAKYKELWA